MKKTFEEIVKATIEHINIATEDGMSPFGCILTLEDFFNSEEDFFDIIVEDGFDAEEYESKSELIEDVFFKVNEYFN